jgi:hypothetical protein
MGRTQTLVHRFVTAFRITEMKGEGEEMCACRIHPGVQSQTMLAELPMLLVMAIDFGMAPETILALTQGDLHNSSTLAARTTTIT